MAKAKLLLAVPLVVIAVAGVSLVAHAGDIIVGENVASPRQISLDQIDHSNWNLLLKHYVNERGRVDYAAWKASSADSRLLDQYLNQLSRSNGQGSRSQQLAFWINAYNAVTVKGILREYPTSSIRNHTARFFGYNIWKNLKLVVGGTPISLDEMEHQVLRKMGEPRIHFAIVCASIGCPRLLNEAYVPEKLDEQLAASARRFFSDPTKFRYDSARNVFHISPILQWFGEDFGSSRADQLKRISAWIPERSAAQAAAAGRGSISFLDYDWGLNDQKSR